MPDYLTMDIDELDPHGPIFWETVHWLATQGVNLSPPDLDLPAPSLGVQVLELTRKVALKTVTQLMPVIPAE